MTNIFDDLKLIMTSFIKLVLYKLFLNNKKLHENCRYDNYFEMFQYQTLTIRNTLDLIRLFHRLKIYLHENNIKLYQLIYVLIAVTLAVLNEIWLGPSRI